jgi:hypothetical protein
MVETYPKSIDGFIRESYAALVFSALFTFLSLPGSATAQCGPRPPECRGF